LLFIVHGHDDLLPLIQHEYLRSETVEHRDDQDEVQFMTVRVDPALFPRP
jgi:hypothetical protein